MCIFQTQSEHQIPFLAEFLVETQITGCDSFFCLEVGGEFFLYLLFFEQACIIQVESSQIFFAYETAYFVLISRNVSVTILVDGSSQTGFVETFFIQRGIFVEVNLLILSLMYYFGTEA